MSLDAMQLILCRCLVDGAFLHALRQAPRAVLAEYDLTTAERTVLLEGRSGSLAELARAVEAWRRGELLPTPFPIRPAAVTSPT